jgi:hypothetical protein
VARVCSVCMHPERETIDRELARGAGPVIVGRRASASEGGRLTKDTLRYRRERHLGYLFDPALGLGPADLVGIRVIDSGVSTRPRGV